MPDQRDYVDRLAVNMQYYQANYLFVVFANLLLVCFWRPLFLLGLMGIVGAAVYLFSVRKTPIQVAEGKVLSRKETMLAYGGFSLLLCLLFGGSHSILGLAIAALMILLHSSFRQRSLKSKVNVGFSNLVSGKSEDGPDDIIGALADEENPPGSARGGANDLSRLSASRSDDLLSQQARDRAAFRATMRSKYLKRT